ncbi:MAG: DUF6305 family protein [Acholeplasmataceae bacterium]
MKKKIIKLINVILLIVASLFFSSCKNSVVNEPIDTSVFPDAFSGIINNKKVYVTSFGQSIDIEDIIRELDALNVSYTRNNYLENDDIANDSVVIMVIGCSIKGLQEAGTSVEAESVRAQKIINSKDDKNLILIAFHIGGVERRGRTSDGLISSVMNHTDFNIFYKPGDYDGYLSTISSKNNIPMYGYEFPSQLLQTIKKITIGDDES